MLRIVRSDASHCLYKVKDSIRESLSLHTLDDPSVLCSELDVVVVAGGCGFGLLGS